MKNTLFLLLTISIFNLLTSCNEKTPKEQIEFTVKDYVDNLFKDEPISDYKIDSLIVKDVTEKVKLSDEALYLKELSNIKLKEAKELGQEYQILPSNITKAKFEKLQTEILELHNKAKELAQKSQIADSLEILYYDVTARGTIISTNNLQETMIIPFHISKDYKILKDPTELRQKQLQLFKE